MEALGNYRGALLKYSQAWDLRKELRGEDDLQSLKTLEMIGWAHFQLQDYRRAGEIFRSVLSRK